MDDPPQDCGPLGLELLPQILVALALRNGHPEQEHVHPPLYRLVDRPQARLVVAGDPHLELRQVVEEVLPHEPCGDLAPPRSLRASPLPPPPPLLPFASGAR